MGARLIKSSLLFLTISAMFCLITPLASFSGEVFTNNNEPLDAKKKPKVEPLDHMPKGEREDWEYNLLMMDEPDESIIMYEQTTKRYPVPIDESSENLTVITRRRIERMNAHSVYEVLKRVCGVFVSPTSGEVGSTSFISIEASEPRHVLILIDGVPVNYLSMEQNAETNFIPLGIIDRIEVVKGPASSVWGSSLGGVVNIITRTGGEDLDKPASAITATYGEKNTADYRATFSKNIEDKYNVLCNASNQRTNGIIRGRNFDKNSLFLKLSSGSNNSFKANFSTLVSESTTNEPTSTGTPDIIDSDQQFDHLLSNASIVYQPNDKATLNFAGFYFKNDYEADIYYPTETDHYVVDDTSMGLSSQLHIKTKGFNTTTIGFDSTDCKVETSEGTTEYEKYAFYINQKYDFYHFMILPGIRIDYNDISKEFISPSLGFSLNITDNFVVRLTTSRGFSAPQFNWISKGIYGTIPNPDLKREEVYSYQAGFESTELWFMAMKANYFYHDLNDTFGWEEHKPINTDNIIRQGVELEATTKAFYKCIFYVSGAYVYTKDKNSNLTTNRNAGNIGLRYNDRQTLRFELNGHFQDYDMLDGGLDIASGPDSWYNETDIIWDTTLCKTLKYWGKYNIEFILKAHNIFNGNQFYADNKYWSFDDIRNPHRWIETGVSFKF